MQTILGSGGAIGTELTKHLTKYTDHIRLVSRNPKKVNPTDELFSCDLLNKESVQKAVEGSEICYVTVGLKYSSKVWEEQWHIIIDNVIEACKYHKSKLVFFDNVYSIGGDNVQNITENSPISPTSRKGRVRAEISKKLMSYFDKSELDVMIVRSPDFFSSLIQNSALMIMVYDNLKKGKKAQWFCSGDFIHSIGYAPELAKGMAMLGNEKDTYNQIWNLPVDNKKLTGKQWAALFAELMGIENKFSATPAIIFKVIGWFVPMMSELHDMIYQYDREYFFDSSKFNNRFNYKPISNREAVLETLKILGDIK